MSDPLPFIASASGATPIAVIRPEDWPAFQDTLSPAQKAFAAHLDWRGQAGRSLSLPAAAGGVERVLFCLAQTATPMTLAGFAGGLAPGDYRLERLPQDISPTLAALAWALGTYRFTRYKARKAPAARLVWPEGSDQAEAIRLAEAVRLVRDLVNTPAQDMGPDALETVFQAQALHHGAAFETIAGDALLKANYPLIHAVGRAAAEAPRLVRLRWGDPAHPRVALVGKGVTFDTGGLDVKPSAGMRIMKKDMGGAAHALALGRLVMDAGLPVHLEVTAAIVENALSANALRPGDIVKSRKGLTVEIDNTDAEGRLILADALVRACEDTPELLLDFATLTGAARTALGPDVPPFFTDDETLAADLAAAAQAVHDPLWRLPLWMGYDADMDSPIADLKNTGDGAFAGAIFGALFLKRFVTASSWAHFDIYAWSNKERGGRPVGGDAHALRAVWEVLKARYPKS